MPPRLTTIVRRRVGQHVVPSALGVALLCAPAAMAQQPQAASDQPEISLLEIDVQATAWRSWQPVQGYVAPVTTTGSKTDTPLTEAPQLVGVVTRNQIDDQGAFSVSQALRYTAGVLPEARPSARYDSVFVGGAGVPTLDLFNPVYYRRSHGSSPHPPA